MLEAFLALAQAPFVVFLFILVIAATAVLAITNRRK